VAEGEREDPLREELGELVGHPPDGGARTRRIASLMPLDAPLAGSEVAGACRACGIHRATYAPGSDPRDAPAAEDALS
jgi:hypothetical protein